MTSSRPYLLRALYEWIVDNGHTPHVLVDATKDGVVVPEAYVDDGRIVLNIDPAAVRTLELGNDAVSFGARFGGQPLEVYAPISAVLGIYARENGHGMLFPELEAVGNLGGDGSDDDPPPASPSDGRPALRIVK